MLKKVTAVLLAIGIGLLVLTACGGSQYGAGGEGETRATEVAGPATAAELPVIEGARTFKVVPAESRASYIVREEFFAGALSRLNINTGKTETVGSTREVAGSLQLKLDGPEPAIAGQFTVNLRSLTSDQERRDRRIRTNDLQSDTYPIAELRTQAVEGAPTNYNEGDEASFKLHGDLTIREITRPATFDVTATLEGDTIAGVATTTMRMTDFGFNPPAFANILSVEDEFTVRLEFTLRES